MTDQNKSVLEGIRELTPHIIARGAEIEAARRIPLDIVQSLKSAGVFRMFVPRSHGGLELALPTGLEAIRALGRVDGSVGWTAMIGSGSALFASLLPRETYDRIYERGPDVIFAGSSQPVGKAETTADGGRGLAVRPQLLEQAQPMLGPRHATHASPPSNLRPNVIYPCHVTSDIGVVKSPIWMLGAVHRIRDNRPHGT